MLTLALGGGDAAACACCAEPGYRLEKTEPVSTNVRDELGAIRLAPVAMLYNGARGADGVQGVRGASEKPYKITLTRPGNSVVFDVVDATGQSGRISFAMPQRLSRFEIDPRTDAKATGSGPNLYKEWRLEGPATTTGIFAGAKGPVTARLVLQGRGNLCTAAPNFAHWHLTLTGAGTSFSLFGDTKP
jgi:hypothetical protein